MTHQRTTVQDWMTENLITVAPDEPLFAAVEQMAEQAGNLECARAIREHALQSSTAGEKTPELPKRLPKLSLRRWI